MSDKDLRQRLAAILAADVAGYSRLMAADDRATVAALDAARGVFRSRIESHQGRVIDMAGDSVLAVFETATGAVTAALANQKDIHGALDSVPEDRRMRFRIGVNLGDVIEKTDGTVYGDGVNIAARLESLGEPGGITVSEAVRTAVRGKVEAEFEDRGEQQVKNIPVPVRAYRLRTGSEAAVQAPSPAEPPLPDRPSIAVLPFSNMSGDPEQEYFADGMVEEIITALARMGAFFVIARNSSFAYKGKAVDIKQVGRELGVRYVLEGSVRKAGNRVRITGQLVEAENGRHVWADRFEGTLDDIFELQDRITESVVWAIEPNIRRAELERSRVKPASNLQAYDLLLRALGGLMPGASGAAIEESMGFIRRAIEMDPKYSLAKSLGSFACLRRLMEGRGGADEVKLGLRYADEALADHQDNAQILSCAGLALGSLGFRALGFRVLGFRYDDAQRAIQRALSLSPNLFMVPFAAGMVESFVGNGEVAIAHFDRAIRLSPLDPAMGALLVGSGVAHVVAGRYEEALEMGRRTVQQSPNFASGHRLMLVALGNLGRMEEAKAAARRMLELAPEVTVSRYESVSPFKDAEFRKRGAAILRAAGVPG
jgi:adenylate cyclase